jgi:hypothetical protein
MRVVARPSSAEKSRRALAPKSHARRLRVLSSPMPQPWAEPPAGPAAGSGASLES